jgi:hypothetical protein
MPLRRRMAATEQAANPMNRKTVPNMTSASWPRCIARSWSSNRAPPKHGQDTRLDVNVDARRLLLEQELWQKTDDPELITGNSEVTLVRFPRCIDLSNAPRLSGALFKSTKSNCCLRLPRSTTASDANGSQPGSHSFREVLRRANYGFYGAAEISGSLSKPIPEVVTEKGEGRSPSSRVARSAIRDRCQEIRRKRAECSLR